MCSVGCILCSNGIFCWFMSQSTPRRNLYFSMWQGMNFEKMYNNLLLYGRDRNAYIRCVFVCVIWYTYVSVRTYFKYFIKYIIKSFILHTKSYAHAHTYTHIYTYAISYFFITNFCFSFSFFSLHIFCWYSNAWICQILITHHSIR